jgi:hypothetical protein
MYLEENVAALNLTLSADMIKQIDDMAPVGFTLGTRYPEAMMGALSR